MRIHEIMPLLLKDFYKVGHVFQYPKNTTMVYSNLTPRSSRIEGTDAVIAFGFQYFVLEYLIDQFAENFFDLPLDLVMRQYKRTITNALGPNAVTFDHIEALHKLQFLPLHIKAVPEGTLVPLRVPVLTIRNTEPEFFWLTNMLETLMSNVLWLPSTSATTAFKYRQMFERYAKLTGASRDFVKWQGHDFSMRGMAGIEAACLSGAAHLLSFTGTDTIPAIPFLEEYYGANSDKELVGGSVPATEHSVMCVGTSVLGREEEFIRWLIAEVYPKGIVSIVSDTRDYWQIITEVLPRLKDVILARDGKVVIRPDSGDPVKIICGDPDWAINDPGCPAGEGTVKVLWDIFGGTMTPAGYRELDPHVGLIYGDSITPDRQKEILANLASKGFASSNVVLGIGSFTYQHVTRDTYGWAIKATYAEAGGTSHNIYKEPKTDSGLKNSAKGLLSIQHSNTGLVLAEECDWLQESEGMLQTIFLDGTPHNLQSLASIRARIDALIPE